MVSDASWLSVRQDVECAQEVQDMVSHHVAEVHLSVNATSIDHFNRERR
jgi:hypothetical protein